MHTDVSAQLFQHLLDLADPERAKINAGFSKTGNGEYAEGDKFLGLRVPQLREIVRGQPIVALEDILPLLHNAFHEARLLALLLMVKLYKKADDKTKQQVFDCYLANTCHINNWDLVDSSCYYIVGPHLWNKDSGLLFELSQSDNMWERRIAVVITYYFIKKGHFATTFQLVRNLLTEPQHIVQKAMGWMLKEISKQNPEQVIAFLQQQKRVLPRLVCRIALEKFSPEQRKLFLQNA